MIPWHSYQFGMDEPQGNTRMIAQLILHSVHKIGGMVVASPILGMSVEDRVWACWASGKKVRETNTFCNHMTSFVLPLYLGMGIKGVIVFKDQGLLRAI